MQLISKAIVDGTLESLSAPITVAQLKRERGDCAPNEGNRQQRRAAAAIDRKKAKREGKAACAR